MKDEMHDIVRKSNHLTEYDKEILCALYDNLRANQDKLFRNIADSVAGQMRSINEADCDWSVVTAMIDKADVESARKSGFYELCNITSFDENVSYDSLVSGQEGDGDLCGAGVSFLLCQYHEMASYIKQEYSAHVVTETEEYDIKYRLKPFTFYYEMEERLERTARQYGVRKPALFSPLSRRAVVIIAELGGKEVSSPEKTKIDFQLAENGLAGILQCGKTLVWNVETMEKEDIPHPRENIKKQIVPLFDDVYQLYEFMTQPNEYIYVEAGAGDVKRYGNSVYLNLCSNQNLSQVRYWKLTIQDYTKTFLGDMEYQYSNFYENRSYKERVRTEADIAYVLGYFSNETAVYESISRSLDHAQAIRTYESRDAYHYPKNKHFRSSAVCYVKFRQSDSWLFEDYVSYILSYMNYCYPEFYWVGVV